MAVKYKKRKRKKSNIRKGDIKLFVCVAIFLCFSLVRYSNIPVFNSIRSGLDGLFEEGKAVTTFAETIGEKLEQSDAKDIFSTDTVKAFAEKVFPSSEEKSDEIEEGEKEDKSSDNELLSSFADRGSYDFEQISFIHSEQSLPKEFYIDKLIKNEDEKYPEKVDMTKYAMAFSHQNPVKGVLTSSFGYREHPIDKVVKFHYGIDLGAEEGTSVYSFAKGQVISISESEIYGKCLLIKHTDGFFSFYAHCSEIYVSEGEEVSKGNKIAAVGKTGKSTGSHLHFEVRKGEKRLDPNYYVNY